jgi:alkyl sulfatase BDS1-like metallo-beta-lactamase superfamily hydrolase
MIMYYPQLRLLNMAEDTTHTLHNIYTIRGAQVRDARLWSRYIGEALNATATARMCLWRSTIGPPSARKKLLLTSQCNVTSTSTSTTKRYG